MKKLILVLALTLLAGVSLGDQNDPCYTSVYKTLRHSGIDSLMMANEYRLLFLADSLSDEGSVTFPDPYLMGWKNTWNEGINGWKIVNQAWGYGIVRNDTLYFKLGPYFACNDPEIGSDRGPNAAYPNGWVGKCGFWREPFVRIPYSELADYYTFTDSVIWMGQDPPEFEYYELYASFTMNAAAGTSPNYPRFVWDPAWRRTDVDTAVVNHPQRWHMACAGYEFPMWASKDLDAWFTPPLSDAGRIAQQDSVRQIVYDYWKDTALYGPSTPAPLLRLGHFDPAGRQATYLRYDVQYCAEGGWTEAGMGFGGIIARAAAQDTTAFPFSWGLGYTASAYWPYYPFRP